MVLGSLLLYGHSTAPYGCCRWRLVTCYWPLMRHISPSMGPIQGCMSLGTQTVWASMSCKKHQLQMNRVSLKWKEHCVWQAPVYKSCTILLVVLWSFNDRGLFYFSWISMKYLTKGQIKPYIPKKQTNGVWRYSSVKKKCSSMARQFAYGLIHK